MAEDEVIEQNFLSTGDHIEDALFTRQSKVTHKETLRVLKAQRTNEGKSVVKCLYATREKSMSNVFKKHLATEDNMHDAFGLLFGGMIVPKLQGTDFLNHAKQMEKFTRSMKNVNKAITNINSAIPGMITQEVIKMMSKIKGDANASREEVLRQQRKAVEADPMAILDAVEEDEDISDLCGLATTGVVPYIDLAYLGNFDVHNVAEFQKLFAHLQETRSAGMVKAVKVFQAATAKVHYSSSEKELLDNFKQGDRVCKDSKTMKGSMKDMIYLTRKNDPDRVKCVTKFIHALKKANFDTAELSESMKILVRMAQEARTEMNGKTYRDKSSKKPESLPDSGSTEAGGQRKRRRTT